MIYEKELEKSLTYLNSEDALSAVEVDPYWPKWDSPWWHMLLLHEMGDGEKIPAELVAKFIEAMNRYPIKIFPIRPEEMPEGVDPYRGSSCHCQLGNVYQVLTACGVNVDSEVPWIRPWFLRYQMSDGGFNCDNEAYLVENETPSSMVGTIAVFEAVLMCTQRDWTREEKVFLKKGADFLIKRKLMLGSETKYNASERKSAESWPKLCFPRYYKYDVLRGLNALSVWSEKTGESIPVEATEKVVGGLEKRFPDGVVKNERLAYQGDGTLLNSGAEKDWDWQENALMFPLLSKVSAVGEDSPFLSKQWRETKERLENRL